ncbi:MAG TPA: hypothetical protein PKC76_04320 [Saprospiraceae bacterium]|nr:hypothetical protein [Saprospiraceae bacterium]HMP23329.1 hypothetical protein [Saprospiraceae bacterium]
MKQSLLLFACLLMLLPLGAQEVKPFNFKAGKPLVLKSEVLAQLFDKTWTSYRQYSLLNNEAAPSQSGFLALKIRDNNQYQISDGGRREQGTWALAGRNQLKLTPEDAPATNTGSTYLIYHISATDIVLVKAAEAEHPGRIICGKGAKIISLEETPEGNMRKETREQREKNALIDEIKIEYLLRGNKKMPNLTTMNKSQLTQVRNDILRGKATDRTSLLRDEVKAAHFMRKLELPADFNEMNYRQLKKLKQQISNM